MNQSNEARILAIDYGIKRIGLAITDPLNIFAYPLITLENNDNFWKELGKVIEEYNVKKILIGDPLKESGEKSTIYSAVKKFKEKIENHFNIQVELVDERYSSSLAKKRILETVQSKKKRRDKSLLDKNSAAILLEDYLRAQTNSNKRN